MLFQNTRLAIFTDALHEQKCRLSALLRSTVGLGSTETMKPSVFQRLMLTLTQIADGKDAEMKLITQIDAMEKEHRNKRRRRTLRVADPALAPSVNTQLKTDLPEVKRPEGLGIWGMLLFFAALTNPKPTHK